MNLSQLFLSFESFVDSVHCRACFTYQWWIKIITPSKSTAAYQEKRKHIFYAKNITISTVITAINFHYFHISKDRASCDCINRFVISIINLFINVLLTKLFGWNQANRMSHANIFTNNVDDFPLHSIRNSKLSWINYERVPMPILQQFQECL